tara:strand:- start:332 stop:451 length:120 start_codon:yes stop_codon:yes gene_type:complete
MMHNIATSVWAIQETMGEGFSEIAKHYVWHDSIQLEMVM